MPPLALAGRQGAGVQIKLEAPGSGALGRDAGFKFSVDVSGIRGKSPGPFCGERISPGKAACIEMRPAGLLAAVVILSGTLLSIRFCPYASAGLCAVLALQVCCKSFKAAVVPKEAPPPVSRMPRARAAHMHRAPLYKLA